jgi:6-phosphogluconolactonase (cycloisomerase 2 family)
MSGPGNSISAFHIEWNGSLTPVAGSPFPEASTYVSSMAVSQGRYLYTASLYMQCISVYQIYPNGRLEPVATINAPLIGSLAVDPYGRFVYATIRDGSGDPGEFGTPQHVSTYRIGANGTLTHVVGSTVSAGFLSSAIVPDPKGRFVYIGDSGGSEEDTETVSGFRVGGNGDLVPLVGSPYPNGEAPQGMGVDPYGRFLYSVGEYDMALSAYSISQNGALTEIPGSTGPEFGYEPYNSVAVDPLGRFVYQSTTNPASISPVTVFVYRVGAKGLTLAMSYGTGFYSNCMIGDTSGQFLYAAESTISKAPYGLTTGSSVAIYRVSGNGALTSLPPIQTGFAPGVMAISQ